jgi:hypothetical protein
MSTSLIPLTYWPGPANTGVPAGTVLTPSGSLDLRVNGQVVSNLHITGRVNVYAKDVTIRRAKITCKGSPFAIRTFPQAGNLLIEDVEIDGSGQGGAAVCFDNYTLRRANIHDVVDGPRLGSHSYVVDSWIHDLTRITGSHNDALQTTGAAGIVVRHNRLDAYRLGNADPMNACIMVGSTTSPSVTNLLFEDNYCNGGNYTIGIRPDLVGSGIVFRSNRFGRNYRYGIIARPHSAGVIWDRTNVWFDTGQPIII